MRVVRRVVDSSAGSTGTKAPVAATRSRTTDLGTVVSRATTTHDAPLVDTTAAAVKAAPSTPSRLLEQSAPVLPTLQTTVSTTTSALGAALEPVTTGTSRVTRAVPTLPSLVPRTLTQTSDVLAQTTGTLAQTVTGLTSTATALTRTVGSLGDGVVGTVGTLGGGVVGTVGSFGGGVVGALGGTVAGLTQGAQTGVIGLLGTAGVVAAAPSVVRGPVSMGPGRPTVVGPTPPPAGPGGLARAPVPPAAAPSGSPGSSWSPAEAAARSMAHPVAPGAPAPEAPLAPASPAGTPGGTGGSGVSVPPGLLDDPLALPAILTVLVLSACARRRSWWFPEVAVGPD